MKQQEKVSCKKIVGQTVCKVGSTIIMPKEPVTATIYTSLDCTWCPKEINSFMKTAKKLDGAVKTVVRNIEEARDVGINNISVFPVIDFGNGVVERGRISKMDERDIIGKTLESARNGEMIEKFQDA
jgi:delta-aminolevulinic acid dehydratase/porphobilinogen synthase